MASAQLLFLQNKVRMMDAPSHRRHEHQELTWHYPISDGMMEHGTQFGSKIEQKAET